MKKEIKGAQLRERLLAFRVDGTGAASILEGTRDATLTDNGVGDYTLTFATAFARVPVVMAPGLLAASGVSQIFTVTAAAVRIKIFAVDGVTPLDADFHVMVLGFDSADQI
jgi:hypothetical protein